MPRAAYQGEVTVSFTMCIEHRMPLFAESSPVAAFVEILRDAAQRGSCLAVYCFMPDHLHLILHGDSPASDLWKTAVEFKQRSGYWLRCHRAGISWQKDFHDHVIRQADDLAAHLRYVLENPCRKGLAADWRDYPSKGSIGCTLEDALGGLPL